MPKTQIWLFLQKIPLKKGFSTFLSSKHIVETLVSSQIFFKLNVYFVGTVTEMEGRAERKEGRKDISHITHVIRTAASKSAEGPNFLLLQKLKTLSLSPPWLI